MVSRGWSQEHVSVCTRVVSRTCDIKASLCGSISGQVCTHLTSPPCDVSPEPAANLMDPVAAMLLSPVPTESPPAGGPAWSIVSVLLDEAPVESVMSPDAPLELACFFVPLAVRTTTSPPRTPPVPRFGAPAAPPVIFMWPPMWLPSALAKVLPNIEPAAADPPCSTTFPPAVALLDPAWTRTAPTLNVDWLPLALPPITVTLPVDPAAAPPVPTVAAPVPPTTGLPVADVAEMLPDTPSRLAPLPMTTVRRARAECGG